MNTSCIGPPTPQALFEKYKQPMNILEGLLPVLNLQSTQAGRAAGGMVTLVGHAILLPVCMHASLHAGRASELECPRATLCR